MLKLATKAVITSISKHFPPISTGWFCLLTTRKVYVVEKYYLVFPIQQVSKKHWRHQQTFIFPNATCYISTSIVLLVASFSITLTFILPTCFWGNKIFFQVALIFKNRWILLKITCFYKTMTIHILPSYLELLLRYFKIKLS